uniref:Ufm1-specific protease n=1 Tax=Panagrolaimus superbus TaxID=310955 RepID=A0A914Z6C0_9BILA
MSNKFKEIHISLKCLIQQFGKLESKASPLSKAFYFGYPKSEEIVQITHIIFLSDKNLPLKTLYESFLPAGISLIGFTTFDGSSEVSLLNKSNFVFSQCLIISGNDDWVTKVEMCFEKLFEKLQNLHFTSTHAFVKPVDEESSIISSPFISIPFNLEIEHFGNESSDKKAETLRRAMFQLKELIKRQGPEGDFTKLSKYSSTLFDDNQPFISLKDPSEKAYFTSEIENLANSKNAVELKPLPPMDLDFGKLLINPHLEVKHKPKDLCSIVKGNYAYFHYHCDGFDDAGWGCAYRSLQTIWSWLCFEARINRMPPSHKEIQECLVKIGDKPSKFIGSQGWIGSFEIGFVLQNLANIEYRTLHSGSGKELDEHARALSYHFEHNGAPVMIGGGSYAHTILGVDYNRKTGECEYLILDPHYTGKDIVTSAISGQGIVWKNKNSLIQKKLGDEGFSRIFMGR